MRSVNKNYLILLYIFFRDRNRQVSPSTRCFNYAISNGPVLGNHLGIQELPKDSHIPVDVSPIICSHHKENTPTKNEGKYFIQNILSFLVPTI